MAYTLNIRIIEAKGLPKMDLIGKVDPYCMIRGNGWPQKETKCIKKTYTPVWNEEFSFPVYNLKDKFSILVLDKDLVGSEIFGKIEISFNALRIDDVIDRWFPLMQLCNKKAGEIHLVIHLGHYQTIPFLGK